jgi:hypothetical protein
LRLVAVVANLVASLPAAAYAEVRRERMKPMACLTKVISNPQVLCLREAPQRMKPGRKPQEACRKGIKRSASNGSCLHSARIPCQKQPNLANLADTEALRKPYFLQRSRRFRAAQEAIGKLAVYH